MKVSWYFKLGENVQPNFYNYYLENKDFVGITNAYHEQGDTEKLNNLRDDIRIQKKNGECKIVDVPIPSNSIKDELITKYGNVSMNPIYNVTEEDLEFSFRFYFGLYSALVSILK